MKKCIKIMTSLTAIAVMILFGLTIYLDIALPNKFYVVEGEKVVLHSKLALSMENDEPLKTGRAAAGGRCRSPGAGDRGKEGHTMTTVREIESFLYSWAPRELAESWDNVGLLVGDPEAAVERVLVALDITPQVAEEALERGCQLIVAHHPVMNCAWHPVQTVRADDRQGRTLTALLRGGVAAICMHTNLDAAEGGVNDILAERLGLTQPEMLTEEKIGRIGTLKCEIPLVEFTHSVIELLGCNGLRYVDAGRPVHRVAVGGGACGCYIPQAVAAGCDTFVTSDLKYNDFLDTEGLNLIDAGHFPTENVVCPALRDRLQRAFPAVDVLCSTSHSREIIQYCIKEK